MRRSLVCNKSPQHFGEAAAGGFIQHQPIHGGRFGGIIYNGVSWALL
jgi:hypothetical protein